MPSTASYGYNACAMAWSDEYGCLVSNRALARRGAGVDAAAILTA